MTAHTTEPRTARVTVSLTPKVKIELELEAKRDKRSLSDYIFSLLERPSIENPLGRDL